MKVLFISKLKPNGEFSPIINSQAESLREAGLEIIQWGIKRGGWKGYLNAVFQLRSYLKKNRFDLYHAHYSFSGIVAGMAGAKPLLVSLMGSDLMGAGSARLTISLFKAFFCKACIVKSPEMAMFLKKKNVFVIPNGVNLNSFKPLNKTESQESVGFSADKKHVLFMADPARKEKNFELASQVVKLLKPHDYQLHVIHDIPHDKIPVYLSAAEVLLLTSKYEGSPNIVKEAMACNLPVVSTGVGDVRLLLENTKGCYVSPAAPESLAEYLKKAIQFREENIQTNGREQLLRLGLDSRSIAQRVGEVYKTII